MIKAKRIRNPKRYLYELEENEEFYIAVPLHESYEDVLEKYGYEMSKKKSELWIPLPLKKTTNENINGSWVINKELPKIEREFEREYHVVDWHGNDHYGTCYHTRMCYQRTPIKAEEIAFSNENDVLFSPLYKNSDTEMNTVKVAINILLEIFGQCEIWRKSKTPILPLAKQKIVSWEILGSGETDKDKLKEYVDKTIEVLPKKQRSIIKNRHEFFGMQKPDFCVLGSQNFWGYVVYGFTSKNLYFFECNRPDNATYVFKGDWKKASQLTKTEILNDHLQDERIFHTTNWKENICHKLSK